MNTFHIKVDAAHFAEVASIAEIHEAIDFANENKLLTLVLGGGSNLLFTRNFPGLVLRVNLKGIEVVKETQEYIYIKAGAGEQWDDFVQFCVDNGWGGLENLSLIPGNIGASPIQNIGAYGVEIKDHFNTLEYFSFDHKKVVKFTCNDCAFGYRDSIFKQTLKNAGIILNVTYRLDKNHKLNQSYGAIKSELEKMGVNEPGISDIRQAVITIRQSKLPDPIEIGNAGSFFKNPEVSAEKQNTLKRKYSDLVSYPMSNGNFKLAAGWLIDQCGWKGKRKGDAGVHEKQALVLVNYGNATGSEILNLAVEVEKSVFEKYGVMLEREVVVL